MSKEVVKSGKYLNLIIKDGWEYIERINCDGVVIIIGKTDEDEVILIDQFRYPVGQNVIAFPAGLAGDKGAETFAEAAQREFLEETGFHASNIEHIFEGPVSAGMCKDTVNMFYASGLKKVHEGGGVEDHEDITVHRVPLSSVDQWLKDQQKKGMMIAPNIFSGLYFLRYWVA